MVTKSPEEILRDIIGKPSASYRHLTFGELAVGDRYIVIPPPGDNSGDEGFRSTYNLFMKMKQIESPSLPLANSVRIKNGLPALCTDDLPVIRVE